MLSFLRNPRDKQPVKQYSQYRNVQSVIHEDIQKTIQFYKGINWSVSGDHILITLLNSIHSEGLTQYDIYNSIIPMVQMVTHAKGIASNIAYGRVQHKSYFYGKDTQEILLDQRFDDAYIQMMTKHYSEWETIRVIRHPFTSMDFQLPNGKKRKTGEKGLVVIKMDLALLYTQYKMWLRDWDACHYFDGTHKATTNFVHSYPLPHMLKSHVDMVWCNRLFHKTSGLPVSNEKPDTRLMLMNPYIGLENLEENILRDLSVRRMDFYEICSIVPCIFSKNLLSFFREDNVLETQQLRLGWALGYIPLIHWLMKLDQETSSGMSSQWKTEYCRKYKEYDSSNLWKTIRFLALDEIIPFTEVYLEWKK